MNTYEDKIVTDIERIRRAKAVLYDEYVDKRTRNEAIELIRTYRAIVNEVMERSNNEDERERAKELLYELRIL